MVLIFVTKILNHRNKNIYNYLSTILYMDLCFIWSAINFFQDVNIVNFCIKITLKFHFNRNTKEFHSRNTQKFHNRNKLNIYKRNKLKFQIRSIIIFYNKNMFTHISDMLFVPINNVLSYLLCHFKSILGRFN